MRLNWDESKIVKPVRFKLNKNGFEFNNFSSIQGLSVIGNVNQKKNNNFVRFDQMKTSKESGIHSNSFAFIISFRMYVV